MSQDGAQPIKIEVTSRPGPTEPPPDYRVMTSEETDQMERFSLEIKCIENDANRWLAEERLAETQQELARRNKFEALGKLQKVQERAQVLNNKLKIMEKDDLKLIGGRWYVKVRPEIKPDVKPPVQINGEGK